MKSIKNIPSKSLNLALIKKVKSGIPNYNGVKYLSKRCCTAILFKISVQMIMLAILTE